MTNRCTDGKPHHWDYRAYSVAEHVHCRYCGISLTEAFEELSARMKARDWVSQTQAHEAETAQRAARARARGAEVRDETR